MNKWLFFVGLLGIYMEHENRAGSLEVVKNRKIVEKVLEQKSKASDSWMKNIADEDRLALTNLEKEILVMTRMKNTLKACQARNLLQGLESFKLSWTITELSVRLQENQDAYDSLITLFKKLYPASSQ